MVRRKAGRRRLTIPLITSNTSRPLKCNLVFGSVYLAGRPVISQYFLAGSSDGGAWDVRSESFVMVEGEGDWNSASAVAKRGGGKDAHKR
jgi:hypothetical protein